MRPLGSPGIERDTLGRMSTSTPQREPAVREDDGLAAEPLPMTLKDGARAPRRAHADDAGLDLASTVNLTIAPGGRATVPTGIAIALPHDTVGLVCPRSGLASKHGVTVLNGPGVVDAGYRGEIRVVLHNTDAERPCEIAAGDRIAQLVILPMLPLEPQIVEDLGSSERADRGFGSTGGAQALQTERKA